MSCIVRLLELQRFIFSYLELLYSVVTRSHSFINLITLSGGAFFHMRQEEGSTYQWPSLDLDPCAYRLIISFGTSLETF